MLKYIHIRGKKGFTLVELIVVIAILAILIMIGIPKLNSFRETAEIRTVEANHRTLINAAQMYYVHNLSWPQLEEDDTSLDVLDAFINKRNFKEDVGKYKLKSNVNQFDIISWHGEGTIDEANEVFHWNSRTQSIEFDN